MKENNENSWDEYWSIENSPRFLNRVYNSVASFYRVKLIGPRLNFELGRQFEPSSKLIHAGSGAGEVDSQILVPFDILAVDISSHAVDRYQKIHPSRRAKKADIFDLSVLEEDFDGIYNLGVMEHFSMSECEQILSQFYSVLKPGGKIVLFWPPHYGSSVIFLHFIHGLMKLTKGKNFEPLHPEEPNKIMRKSTIKSLLQRSGFEMTGYSFSFRDNFTYISVVGKKL